MSKQFQVGDVLRIRQWDDMAAEFGESGDCIECEFTFTEEMRYMCGERFVVKSVSYGRYRSESNIEDGFSISADMLEYDVPDVEIEEISDADFETMVVG